MARESSNDFFQVAELPGKRVKGDIAVAAGVVFTQREIEVFDEQMAAIYDMETAAGAVDTSIRII